VQGRAQQPGGAVSPGFLTHDSLARSQDDPRGAIPKSIVNWAAKKAFPSGMDDTVRAAKMSMSKPLQKARSVP
jgi:hypothetical protein